MDREELPGNNRRMMFAELDYRENDGIEVSLPSNRADDTLSVLVVDVRTDETFELPVHVTIVNPVSINTAQNATSGLSRCSDELTPRFLQRTSRDRGFASGFCRLAADAGFAGVGSLRPSHEANPPEVRSTSGGYGPQGSSFKPF
jgi:hypothetical protein